MGVYLRLFHGRKDPDAEMDDWGNDGPVFGPLAYVHTTYGSLIHLGDPDDGDTLCDLTITKDGLVYYDGVYYGDWTVFGPDKMCANYRRMHQPVDESKTREEQAA